jgi:hypothetical protein
VTATGITEIANERVIETATSLRRIDKTAVAKTRPLDVIETPRRKGIPTTQGAGGTMVNGTSEYLPGANDWKRTESTHMKNYRRRETIPFTTAVGKSAKPGPNGPQLESDESALRTITKKRTSVKTVIGTGRRNLLGWTRTYQANPAQEYLGERSRTENLTAFKLGRKE